MCSLDLIPMMRNHVMHGNIQLMPQGTPDLLRLCADVTGVQTCALPISACLLYTSLVKAYIESLAGKLRLFFLPPYSPELNPDELVWNDVKNNAVGRSRHDGPEDLRRAVLGRLRFLQKRPDRVRSFFQAPETRYAA